MENLCEHNLHIRIFCCTFAAAKNSHKINNQYTTDKNHIITLSYRRSNDGQPTVNRQSRHTLRPLPPQKMSKND